MEHPKRLRAVSIGHTERRYTGRGTYCEWGGVQPEYENIHHKGDRSVRLAKTWTWRHPADGSVDLDAIEGTILDASKRFKLGAVFYDPWQATHLVQRIRRASVGMQEVTFSGPILQAMATATLDVFNSSAVRLYPEEQLLSDLRKLRVIEKSYGFQLESPHDVEFPVTQADVLFFKTRERAGIHRVVLDIFDRADSSRQRFGYGEIRRLVSRIDCFFGERKC